MMNRKAEKILAWIANGLSLLFLILMILGLILLNFPESKEALNQIYEQQGMSISADALKSSILMQGGFLLFATILGFCGVFTIKGNRILAGCLLIAAALISLFTGNFIALILWIIAGIMLLVKKDKGQPQYHNQIQQNDFSEDAKDIGQRQKSDMNPEQELKKKKDEDPYIY